jgi:uncharacterized protein (TIGR02328 family)
VIITRIWDYRLLPYLPDAQFKGQLRELVLIMRTWRDTGKTNHLLINRVMEYPKCELTTYFLKYGRIYYNRYRKSIDEKYYLELQEFCNEYKANFETPIFDGWHNREYLRVCMANLYEKHIFGIGKSRITDDEWARLCDGYKTITGEEYAI